MLVFIGVTCNTCKACKSLRFFKIKPGGSAAPPELPTRNPLNRNLERDFYFPDSPNNSKTHLSGLLLSGSIKIGRSAPPAPALPAGAFCFNFQRTSKAFITSFLVLQIYKIITQ
nr:MAG TPA: hypothetical protein [Caudoviricetes sp.]